MMGRKTEDSAINAPSTQREINMKLRDETRSQSPIIAEEIAPWFSWPLNLPRPLPTSRGP